MRRLSPMIRYMLVAAVAGCGGGGTDPGTGNNQGQNPPPPGGGSTTNNITVSNNYFDPLSTTVAVGTRVVWTWNACTSDGYGGSMCSQHNVTFNDGPASSTRSDGDWSRTFTTAGIYEYRCTIHGAGMRGTVVVK